MQAQKIISVKYRQQHGGGVLAPPHHKAKAKDKDKYLPDHRTPPHPHSPTPARARSRSSSDRTPQGNSRRARIARRGRRRRREPARARRARGTCRFAGRRCRARRCPSRRRRSRRAIWPALLRLAGGIRRGRAVGGGGGPGYHPVRESRRGGMLFRRETGCEREGGGTRRTWGMFFGSVSPGG
jgi:hypothetical protein